MLQMWLWIGPFVYTKCYISMFIIIIHIISNTMLRMLRKQCHKPPMTGNGGMVYTEHLHKWWNWGWFLIVLPTVLFRDTMRAVWYYVVCVADLVGHFATEIPWFLKPKVLRCFLRCRGWFRESFTTCSEDGRHPSGVSWHGSSHGTSNKEWLS